MKKLFISQPMKGKSDEDILAERKKAIKSAEEKIGEPVEVIDSFFQEAPVDAKPLWFLGKSLELLAGADVAYFAPGWEDARGCKIEHTCAVEYGIDRIEAQETSLKYIVSDSDNPQTIMLGTPPTVVSAGTVFVKFRETVLAGRGFDSGWAEWSVSHQMPPDDVDSWYEANPSLGTILTERKIRAEITNDDIDFNIQRLGLWLQYNQKSAISEAEWVALTEKEKPILVGKLYVGIKYGHSGNNVAMSVAVKTAEGKIFVEAIDCRPIRAGNEWILSYLSAMKPECVVVDGANGQNVIAAEMKDARMKAPELPSVKEIITANAIFEQGLSSGSVSHFNQPSLTQAASNCQKRAIGSNGGFGYQSTNDNIEIALLDSVILAYWKCVMSKDKKRQQSRY